MTSRSDALPAHIAPTQVWALIPIECQQQIVQLLARLAMHVIATHPPCQRLDVIVKERVDAHPSSSRQGST